MHTFVIWEIRENQKPIKHSNTIKAISSELARRKAVIGTNKNYDSIRAYAFKRKQG
tara:strand:+ start:427 stop:594 length:168 start_codon:yes stop_codon:yes gene_type:complete